MPRSETIGAAVAGRAVDHPEAQGCVAELLVDELEGVGLFVVHVLGIDAGAGHRLEEIAPARIGHRPDPVFLGVAAVDDAVLLDLGDAIGEQRVGHLGVVALDQRVRRRGIAIEIVVPALDAGIDKALHQIGVVANQPLRGLDQRAVARIAGIGEQQHDRFDPVLLDRERLARQIALLDRLRVGEERRHAERVGPDLVVGVAEFFLQEEPAADAGVGADHDRLALQRGETVIPLPRMRDQHRRVFLEHCGNRDHRDVFAHEIERNKGVGGNVEIEPAGGEELRVVDLRPALAQFDIEAVASIDAGGDRLVISAMLGLRLPVGAEPDGLGLRCGASGPARQGARHRADQNRQPPGAAAHDHLPPLPTGRV